MPNECYVPRLGILKSMYRVVPALDDKLYVNGSLLKSKVYFKNYASLMSCKFDFKEV